MLKKLEISNLNRYKIITALKYNTEDTIILSNVKKSLQSAFIIFDLDKTNLIQIEKKKKKTSFVRIENK
jgi:hypothetical protein